MHGDEPAQRRPRQHVALDVRRHRHRQRRRRRPRSRTCSRRNGQEGARPRGRRRTTSSASTIRATAARRRCSRTTSSSSIAATSSSSDPLVEPRTFRPTRGRRRPHVHRRRERAAEDGRRRRGARRREDAALPADRLPARDAPRRRARTRASPTGRSTYDELEPFYAQAERAIGVQGLDGADPFAGRARAPYPMPPGVADVRRALKVASGAQRSATPVPVSRRR